MGNIPEDSLRIEVMSEEASTTQMSSTGNNENQTTLKSEVQPIKYGIGISGFDRITNPSYSFTYRGCCLGFFILILIICCYQIRCLLSNYKYQNPDVIVKFKNFDSVKFPKTVVCPYEIFSNNPKTNNIRRRYSEHFGISQEEVMALPFSEMLNLPDVNLTTLWTLYDIDVNHVKMEYQVNHILLKTCFRLL